MLKVVIHVKPALLLLNVCLTQCFARAALFQQEAGTFVFSNSRTGSKVSITGLKLLLQNYRWTLCVSRTVVETVKGILTVACDAAC